MSFNTKIITGNGSPQVSISTGVSTEAVITSLIAYNNSNSAGSFELLLDGDIIITEDVARKAKFLLDEKINVPLDSILSVKASNGIIVTVSYYQQAIDELGGMTLIQQLADQVAIDSDEAVQASMSAVEAAGLAEAAADRAGALGVMRIIGTHDVSNNTLPVSASIETGDVYKIVGEGTVDGINYRDGDTIVYSDGIWAVLTRGEYFTEGKVDKVAGKELSSNDYTDAEKQKLAGLEGTHFRGVFSSYVNLVAQVLTPVAGDYADVDTGIGADAERYIFDATDEMWVVQQSATTITASQVKTMYEENPDTNALTDTLKAKLESALQDAPTDGKQYARKDASWEEVAGDVEEAPTDGKQYARKDAGWEEVVASGGDFITLDFPLSFVEGEPQPTMLAPNLFPDQTKNYKGKLYYAFNELYGGAIIGYDGEATYTYRVFDTITMGEDFVETPSITVNIEVDFLSRWPLFDGGEIIASGFIVTGTSYTGDLPIYPDDYKLLMKGGMEDVSSGYSEGLYARMVQSNGENYWSRINLDSYFRFPYSVSSGYNLFIGDSFVQAPSIINNLPTANKPYMYNGRSETWVEYKGDEIKDVQDVTGKKWLRTRNANSAEWVLYEEPSPGIEEAPSDGKAYVRKDEAWEETSPATGVSRAASNYIVRAVKDQIVEDGKGFYRGAAWSEELSLWVVCSTIGIYTAPYDSNTWTKVHSTGGLNVIWVSELSLFVVLGTYYVITSSDGTTWTQRDFPSGAPNFQAIAWSPEQGKMIAVSEATNSEGNIISSTDGITWTRSNDLPTSGGGRGEDIIWAPGLSKWVTCGTGGFRISSDGVTWTKVGTPPGVAKNPHSVTYNPSDGSLSATVGITGSSSRAILQSTNGGTSWVKISEVETNGSIATIDWIDDLGMYILTSTYNNKKSFDLLKFTTIVGGGSGPNGLGWGASIASIIFPTNAYGTYSIKKTI